MVWTAITTDTSWQELAIASEIAQAYNLRAAAARSVTKLSTPLDVNPDEDMTVRAFVFAVQNGIEQMSASIWADPEEELEGQDHVIEAYGVAQYEIEEVSYDEYLLLTSAGLTEYGHWRRVLEGESAPDPWTDYNATGWEYGKIGDKDLAGPWLFKDLQTALARMTRLVTVRYPDDPDGTHAASDDGIALSTPSSPSGTPTYGAGVPGSGFMQVVKSVTAYKVDPPRYDYEIDLQHGEISFSSQPAVEKTARVIGIPSLCGTWTDYDYYDYTDEAVYGFAPDVTNIMGEVSTSLPSFSVYNMREETWGFFGAVSWPSVPSLDGGLTSKTVTVGAEVRNNDPLCVVIDYEFDP